MRDCYDSTAYFIFFNIAVRYGDPLRLEYSDRERIQNQGILFLYTNVYVNSFAEGFI